MNKMSEPASQPMNQLEAYPIACNLNAIPAEARPAHEALSEQLFKAVFRREELPDGYAFYWPLTNDKLQKVVTYISNERLCCPFFRFEIVIEPGKDIFVLKLTGQSGVKAFLTSQFN
jgi:hypothetical protein